MKLSTTLLANKDWEKSMEMEFRPNLRDDSVILSLKPRLAPYFLILQYCRHLGLQVVDPNNGFWVARVRRKNGRYQRRRLCVAIRDGAIVCDFSDAERLAQQWFSEGEIARGAAEPYPVGSKRSLSVCPIGQIQTVGHALQRYLEWKLLAATKSHFETLVSLINYHLVPRVSHIPLVDFDGRIFHKLAKDVLETPPKTGRSTPTVRLPIESLSEEALRRRKKTFNALVSILRGAFQLAWEDGQIDTDRPLRCLRRLPNVDRPRAIFLTRVECRRLLSHCHGDLVPLVKAALFTGCRIRELTNMRVQDFAPSQRAVFVRNSKNRRSRFVFLPNEGLEHFAGLIGGRDSSEFVFVKSNGRPWGNEYKEYFRSARNAAGLGPKLTFHGLRHTYASQLLESGASLLSVSQQLGHANTQTVSTTYGHLTSLTVANDIEQCFETLYSDMSHSQTSPGPSLGEQFKKPVTKHQNDGSWPRSNFSRYSGELLPELRR